MCFPKDVSQCNHWCADPKCGHRESIHSHTVELCAAPGCRCVGFVRQAGYDAYEAQIMLSPFAVRKGDGTAATKSEHETQESIHEWCVATFPKYVGTKGRAVALLEEAVELALAAGVDERAIHAAVKVPMLKEAIRVANGERNWHQREDAEEVADVLLCVYAYAQEAGYDAQQELDAKMALNRSRTKEYYEKKLAHKEELGYILPGTPLPE